MFVFFKTKWLKAGVVRTLEQTGLNLQFARHIVSSLDIIDNNLWTLVADCTRGLNNQCSNIFSSFIVLELYKLINREDIVETGNNIPMIDDILCRLQDGIDYQKNMGFKTEIVEAQKKFNYLKNRVINNIDQVTPQAGQHYSSTNNPKHGKEATVIKVTSTQLRIQSTLIRDEQGNLLDKAKDNWSLGYIEGFVDSAINHFGLPLDETTQDIVVAVFLLIYGKKEGLNLLEKHIRLSKGRDEDTVNGSKIGFHDFKKLVSQKSNPPCGWIGHIHDNK
jgi:hypothetical protein